MMQDTYPQAVAIKKGWMTVGILVISTLVAILIATLLLQKPTQLNAMNQNQENNNISNLATLGDVKQISLAANNQLQTANPIPNQAKISSTAAIYPAANQNKPQEPSQAAPQPQPLSPWMKMRLKAMQAPISSNQINLNNSDDADNSAANSASNNANNNETNNQNIYAGSQAQKQAFLNSLQNNSDDYLTSVVQKPISPFEVQAGTIIPAILITGIDSDLPGQILGMVRSNVYDSINGCQLLIPMGSRLVGIYDSQVSYGQTRALVAWQRILFPNGSSIDLQGMPGADLMGYAGFGDKVNNHYGLIFSSVLLMSVLGAGAQLSQPPESNSLYQNPTVGQVMAQNVGTNLANTGDTIINKQLDVQPTIIIRPGYLFNVAVTKDMVFPGAYHD